MTYLPDCFRFFLVLSSTATLSLMAPTWAQITPDNTLGSEGSLVVPDVEVQGDLTDLIEGGAQRGRNCFTALNSSMWTKGSGSTLRIPTAQSRC